MLDCESVSIGMSCYDSFSDIRSVTENLARNALFLFMIMYNDWVYIKTRFDKRGALPFPIFLICSFNTVSLERDLRTYVGYRQGSRIRPDLRVAKICYF